MRLRLNHGVTARLPRTGLALVAALGVLALSACAGTIAMQPAPSAAAVDCAQVTVRLPDSIGGSKDSLGNPNSQELDRRETNAQATGAWGDPASVLLWCGVADPGPSTLPCVTIGGVDWIVDDADAPKYRFTTFGRVPAVSIVVDSDAVSGATAVSDLSTAVSVTQQVDACEAVTN
ncbi:MAG: DUF3515 family protein [Microbacteriaceae bacterium]